MSLCVLLWQGDLGEQRLMLVTKDMVLVPRGTSIEAEAVPDGTIVAVQWGPRIAVCRIERTQEGGIPCAR